MPLQAFQPVETTVSNLQRHLRAYSRPKMPKALESKLKREAAKRGYSEERTGAFVFGTLRKSGWRPKREQRAGAQVRALEEK